MALKNNHQNSMRPKVNPHPPKQRKPQNKAVSSRRRKTKKRKSNRSLYYMLLITFLTGTLVALSLTVFFKIEDIRVIGNDYYANEDIINVTSFKKGENLFLTSTKDVTDSITSKFPYIESVVIKKVLPPSIEIHITPSNVAASLEVSDEEFALISDTGKVLERGLVLLPADVILVKGFNIGDKMPGEYLGEFEPEAILEKDSPEIKELKIAENLARQEQATKEKESLMVVKYLNEAIEETSFNNLTNLDISDPLNMIIVYENRLIFKLGTELDITYKLKFIKDVISNPKLAPDAHGTISAENVTKKSEIVVTLDEDYRLASNVAQEEELEDDSSEASISEE